MPEVDGLLRGAGEEERGVEGVPDHLVDQSEVSMRSRDPPPPIPAHLSACAAAVSVSAVSTMPCLVSVLGWEAARW